MAAAAALLITAIVFAPEATDAGSRPVGAHK